MLRRGNVEGEVHGLDAREREGMTVLRALREYGTCNGYVVCCFSDFGVDGRCRACHVVGLME